MRSNHNFPESKNEAHALQLQMLHPGWLEYQDLLIHTLLFQYGLMAVTVPGDQESQALADDTHFYLGEQEFIPTQNIEALSQKHKKEAKKVKGLLEYLEEKPDAVFSNDAPLIRNAKRRNEIFFPLLLKDKEKDTATSSALYVYPWLSQGSLTDFSGFTHYVTASCLFGANLQAQDKNGNSWPIIKHDHVFYPGQKIERILYNPKEDNAYETTLFEGLEQYAKLMQQQANPAVTPLCLYHLPYYDYILFGVSLFIKGQITPKAFGQLIDKIEAKKKDHAERIQNIFSRFGIDVKIASPFDGLFPPLNKNMQSQTIFQVLELSSYENKSDTSNHQLLEKNLVQRCLAKLIDNEKIGSIWKDFTENNLDTLETLEDLFKVGNAIMVGWIAQESGNRHGAYSVCSLLPATEKQIQLNYQKYSKEINYPQKYLPVFNLTVLDPVLGYNHTSKGRLFYFNECKQSLNKLIQEKGLLRTAFQNTASVFFKHTPNRAPSSTSLDNALNSPKPH